MAGIRMLAWAELRRSWRTMVVFGLVVGIGFGCALAGMQLARRTSTAYARLEHAVRAPDAVVLATGADRGVERVAWLPQVDKVWRGVTAIGQLQGDAVVYAGVIASTEAPPPGLFRPIVVAGRVVDPDADDELVVTEHLAGIAGIAVGDELPLRFLTVEEVAQFDTGFGEPDGPRIRMRIVGVIRAVWAKVRTAPRRSPPPRSRACDRGRQRVPDAARAAPRPRQTWPPSGAAWSGSGRARRRPKGPRSSRGSRCRSRAANVRWSR